MVFRFEVEASEPVLYLYDIQLGKSCTRKGLGRQLMKLLELIAFQSDMHSVMLTVMHANTSAVALYRLLGYTEHTSSPEEDASYSILCKRIPVKRQAIVPSA